MTTTFAMAPATVQKLLDRVIYEAVAECVDFDALRRFEGMLVAELGEICEADVVTAAHVAKAMVDRAWRELAENYRRYVDLEPFGEDCELCREESASMRSS